MFVKKCKEKTFHMNLQNTFVKFSFTFFYLLPNKINLNNVILSYICMTIKYLLFPLRNCHTIIYWRTHCCLLGVHSGKRGKLWGFCITSPYWTTNHFIEKIQSRTYIGKSKEGPMLAIDASERAWCNCLNTLPWNWSLIEESHHF